MELPSFQISMASRELTHFFFLRVNRNNDHMLSSDKGQMLCFSWYMHYHCIALEDIKHILVYVGGL